MDLNCVDNNKIEQLSESIESIATSGQNEIDGNKLKVIKKICRCCSFHNTRSPLVLEF
jgi:hypothetical protein